ncbi:hypothetical protein [Chitinophaga sp. YR627]|uniref:hypothetical protein n=1 Tax=Chitinophaga sp. YR627 TaxID=1881041 RepID=UPI00116011A9|nr:hypothetical protein [Chitinophaga sp. YR627]
MKRLYLSLLLLAMAGGLYAQTSTTDAPSKKEQREERKLKRISLFKQLEEGENLYQREFSIGGRINTDGWAGFFELGWRKSRQKVTYFQFEFAEKKNPKEDKKPGALKDIDQFGFIYSEKPYIYGKQNNFYQAKLGVGQQRLIGGKGNKNGVLVNAIYYGGLSVGLKKPYYLNVVDPNTSRGVQVKYGQDPLYDQAFLDRSSIIGGAGFGKGWSEVSIVPGIHAKTGLRFDWARFNEVVSALEVGVNAEYYTKDVDIMIDQDPKKFFFNAYIALQFGKRWDKK